ncbi:MAG: efflux transporter outer membrane subunit [Hyphomonas sp.]
MKSLLTLASMVFVASCAIVGPNYEPPQIELAKHYAFANSPDLEDAAFDRWWSTFHDPVLDSYMEQGLTNGLNIQLAQERIVEAQSLFRAAGGKSRLPAQLSGNGTAAVGITETGGVRTESETASLGATFVFDLFGGVARGIEQAGAELDAAFYNAQTVRLAYQSELVAAYIETRYYQTAINLARRSIANRQRTLGLVQERVDANVATVLESSRAEAELSLVRADLPSLQIGFESNAVRLATLLTEPTQSVIKHLQATHKGIPNPTHKFAPGVPANLLRNRPDIMSAERTLAARMAAIGVSEAALYPSLSLGGSIRASATADNTLQVGPSLTIPLFSRPRLLINRDIAISRAKQAEISWHATARSAVSEVEQTLSRARNRRTEINALSQASRNYTRLTRLSGESFELGASTLLELLDAQENVSSAANALARARRAYALAIAELSVSTGHGARVGEAPAAAQNTVAQLDSPKP